jgi:hypothetical protein
MAPKLVPTLSSTETRRMAGSNKWLLEWVLPVAVGAGLGLAILFGMRASRSEPCKLVEQWQVNDYDVQDALRDELIALGESARPEMRDAFLECTHEGYPEQKVWVGQLLADEPFHDTRFLMKQAREGKKWDQRAAAVALVEVLEKEVEAEAVLPGILAWLEDLEVEYHVPAITAAAVMLNLDLVPADSRDRLRDALIVLGDRVGRGLPGLSAGADGDISIDDRVSVASALAPLIPDEKAIAALEKMTGDTDEFEEVRVAGIRSLSMRSAMENVELWIALMADKYAIVRQATVENLFRSNKPEFNEGLAKCHLDAVPTVRRGSVWSQTKRGVPSMLPVLHELFEDSEVWVAFDTLIAVSRFKEQASATGVLPAAAGHAMRILGGSDREDAVGGAMLLLYRTTKQAFGVPEDKIYDHRDEIEEAALKAFMADTEGRKQAVAQYAEHWKGAAVFTDDDRAKVLTKLLDHADPDNQARARAELTKMGR